MQALEVSTAISFKNILFLTDFTPASQAAFTYAAALARHFDARVYPAHLITPPMPSELEAPVLPEIMTRIEIEKRQELVEQFKPTGTNYTPLIAEGDIEECVPRWIQEHGIDLVVIGTHGRKGVERLFLGSSAENILRHAACPVLTVGPNVPPNNRGELKINKILFATSLSSKSDTAAAYALSFAQGKELTVLHVLPDDIQLNPDPRDFAEAARERITQLVPPEADFARKPEFVVVEGDPAARILEHAKNEQADLIVLGLCGQQNASTHFRRSIAYKVISAAPCAVLTVR